MRALVWLRADLRCEDNAAIHAAIDAGADALSPVFLFDPWFREETRAGGPRLAFLRACVDELARTLVARGSGLVLRDGAPAEWVPRLAFEARADLVCWSRGDTRFARRRDASVRSALERAGIRVIECKDSVVYESDEIQSVSGRPYAVYTAYRNAWCARRARDREQPRGMPKLPPMIPDLDAGRLPAAATIESNDRARLALPAAGERAARARLAAFLSDSARDYHVTRDQVALDGTSRLSPHLRFGTISALRCLSEAEARIVAEPSAEPGLRKWIDELVWREFYRAVLAEHPRVLRHSHRPEFEDIEWNDDEASFSAWCDGCTGFPIVDAAMRQLTSTGWMHNRLRMIVASFLTRDLLIDWRLGEAFFRAHLVDGDPASNNGGWQWAAGTGTDAQPYFRIFNPVLQGERFDPDGTFVRRFLPELEAVPRRFIHRPWDAPSPPKHYPSPIVSHAERRVVALRRWEAARTRAKQRAE